VAQDGPNSAAAGVRGGDVLAGKCRVERVLGLGEMGVVVAAHHIQLDEKVALKFLLPEAAGNREAVAPFAREARVAARITSEHVVRVSAERKADRMVLVAMGMLAKVRVARKDGSRA
jgi:eukaryotic-like serine/threonine-protein kinase